MHAELVSLLEGADAGALERMVAGSRRHAGRRADEMADVAALPRELGVEPRVSDAERRWLEQLREQHARWLRDAVHRLADELRHHPQPTADHSHRLGRAARRVPERLGLGARSRRPSELVAIVHDVGKLAVPPSCSTIPASSAPPAAPYCAVARSPARTSSPAAPPSSCSPGACVTSTSAGTERLSRRPGRREDPAAGPRRLRDRRVDAMTNHRAYRRALSADEARMRLAVGPGQHFDPAVVRAYLTELHAQGERRLAHGGPPPHHSSELRAGGR
jgi:hypothetical protein